jgi:hypothetical protein
MFGMSWAGFRSAPEISWAELLRRKRAQSRFRQLPGESQEKFHSVALAAPALRDLPTQPGMALISRQTPRPHSKSGRGIGGSRMAKPSCRAAGRRTRAGSVAIRSLAAIMDGATRKWPTVSAILRWLVRPWAPSSYYCIRYIFGRGTEPQPIGETP